MREVPKIQWLHFELAGSVASFRDKGEVAFRNEENVTVEGSGPLKMRLVQLAVSKEFPERAGYPAKVPTVSRTIPA